MNIHSYIARENAEKRTLVGLERRVITDELELRASKKGSGPGEMVGYAAKFNRLSQDLGGFVEKIAPGAFDGVLGDDVRALRNHNDDNLLGRTTAGTLKLSSNTIGLKYEVDLPDTQVGRDTAVLVGRKDMTGSSFQFRLLPEDATWDFETEYGLPVRTIHRVAKLYDIAPVTNPAYIDTEVDMRAFHDALEARNAMEAERLRQEQIRRVFSLAKARLRLAEASSF